MAEQNQAPVASERYVAEASWGGKTMRVIVRAESVREAGRAAQRVIEANLGERGIVIFWHFIGAESLYELNHWDDPTWDGDGEWSPQEITRERTRRAEIRGFFRAYELGAPGVHVVTPA